MPSRAHVLDRVIHQLPCDTAPLVARIDGNHVDDAHSLMECVQCDGGEPHGQPLGDRNEGVSFIARATPPYGFRLNRSPVRLVEALEDRVAQDVQQRLEHRLPRPKG